MSRFQDQTFQDLANEETIKEADEPRSVFYEGKTYFPKENIRSYLFLGIDSPGTIYDEKDMNDGGQADVQMLLVADDSTGTWRILNINRDSMVEVPVLSMFGRVTGYENKQIALAHAYGNGCESSCENAKLAVSRLLNDQKIDGYFALNMDAIKIINSDLGGLEVVVTDDFSQVDPSIQKGEHIQLTDEQAVEYIRTRQHVEDETNETRMKRHESVLKAMAEKLPSLTNDRILSIYADIQDYLVSDLDSQEVLDLVQDCKTMQQLPTETLKGEQVVVGENFGWKLDKTSLKETILALFYEPDQEFLWIQACRLGMDL